MKSDDKANLVKSSAGAVISLLVTLGAAATRRWMLDASHATYSFWDEVLYAVEMVSLALFIITLGVMAFFWDQVKRSN